MLPTLPPHGREVRTSTLDSLHYFFYQTMQQLTFPNVQSPYHPLPLATLLYLYYLSTVSISPPLYFHYLSTAVPLPLYFHHLPSSTTSPLPLNDCSSITVLPPPQICTTLPPLPLHSCFYTTTSTTLHHCTVPLCFYHLSITVPPLPLNYCKSTIVLPPRLHLHRVSTSTTFPHLVHSMLAVPAVGFASSVSSTLTAQCICRVNHFIGDVILLDMRILYIFFITFLPAGVGEVDDFSFFDC